VGGIYVLNVKPWPMWLKNSEINPRSPNVLNKKGFEHKEIKTGKR